MRNARGTSAPAKVQWGEEGMPVRLTGSIESIARAPVMHSQTRYGTGSLFVFSTMVFEGSFSAYAFR
jgi:hypothetical protein